MPARTSKSPKKSSPKPAKKKTDLKAATPKTEAEQEAQVRAQVIAEFKVKAAEKAKAEQEATANTIPLHYDVRDGSYWMPFGGEWIKLSDRNVKRQLIHLGVSYGDGDKIGKLQALEWHLWNALNNSRIHYAGPIAGHRAGVFTNGAGSFLVTKGPEGVFGLKPKGRAKPPAWFFRFLQEVLPQEQWLYYAHWLAIALRSLDRGDFQPGWAAVLAGPKKCGKSLLQTVTTAVLGGREADPISWMMGEDKFNSQLCGAEHWRIEDGVASTDIRSRRAFGNRLKQATVNDTIPVNQKGKDALNLRVFRRVTCSVNDEPENLCVVPPFDDSIADKVSLFKCGIADVGSDRAKTEATFKAELGAIREWLLTGLGDIPPEIRDDRTLIAAWHHSDLVRELSMLSPEMHLLDIIDQVLFSEEINAKWIGRASLLQQKLRSAPGFAFDVERILRGPNLCGSYLARLKKQIPERFSSVMVEGHQTWTIQPPSKSKNPTPL